MSPREPIVNAEASGLPPHPKVNNCTDFGCLLLLFANLVGMAFAMQHAVAYGNVAKLTHGFDWRLKTCGVSEGVLDAPYLYMCARPVGGELVLSDGICVKSCPSSSEGTNLCPGQATYLNPPPDKYANGTEVYTTGLVRTLEPVTNYATTAVPLIKYCFPSQGDSQYKDILSAILSSSQFQGDAIFTVSESVMNQEWTLPVIVLVAAIIFCYVFLYLMRYFVRIIVYVLISLLALLWIGLASYTTYGYFEPEKSPLRKFTDDKNWSLGTAIVLWVLTPLILCVLMHLLRRLSLVVQAVQDAGDALVKMPTLLLVPLVQVASQLAIVFGGAYGLLWVLSLGDVKPTSSLNIYDPSSFASGVASATRTVEWTTNQKWLMAYWVLAIVWLQQIAVAAGKFVISFSVVKFKWKKQQCGTMIFQGYFSAYVMHLGTLSAGAFILGLLWVVTACLKFLLSQAKNPDGSQNRVAKILECCCVNCLVCLAKMVEYLNAMAYTECAITGDGYCKSAGKAFRMLLSEADAFGLVVFVTRVIKFTGVATATIGGTWLVALVQTNQQWQDVIDGATGLDSGDIFMEQQKFGGQVTAAVILFVVSFSFMEIFDWTSNSLMYVILWIKAHHGDEAAEHTGSFKGAKEHLEAGGD